MSTSLFTSIFDWLSLDHPDDAHLDSFCSNFTISNVVLVVSDYLSNADIKVSKHQTRADVSLLQSDQPLKSHLVAGEDVCRKSIPNF